MAGYLSPGLPHCFDNFDRFDAHRRYLREQVDHFLLVVGEAIGVEFFADGGVLGLRFLQILIDEELAHSVITQRMEVGFS